MVHCHKLPPRGSRIGFEGDVRVSPTQDILYVDRACHLLTINESASLRLRKCWEVCQNMDSNQDPFFYCRYMRPFWTTKFWANTCPFSRASVIWYYLVISENSPRSPKIILRKNSPSKRPRNARISTEKAPASKSLDWNLGLGNCFKDVCRSPWLNLRTKLGAYECGHMPKP